MAKLKFKDENSEFIPVVQDVKVNNLSVFDGENANIQLKTINNQNIMGSGNIEIDVEDVVKTTVNQGLTTQQKLNARNNIEALGNGNIKQGTGTSTTDVISQKGVTDEINKKQDAKPDGRTNLIASDTGKLNIKYLPATVLGGITYGGTFNDRGYITASSYAPELDGEDIRDVSYGTYPSFYFIYSGPDKATFFGFEYSVGDMALSTLNGWAHLNSTDAVTSVNGKVGSVILNADDIGAALNHWGTDNANKNLVTDAFGVVTVSDYALGQIIVDYYEELPTNVPETAKASVVYPSSYTAEYTDMEINDSIDNSTIYNDFIITDSPTRPSSEDVYVGLYSEDGRTIDMSYSVGGGATEAVYSIGYVDENGINHEYYYSYIVQEYAYSGEETVYLQVGWNEVFYDEETGNPYVVQIQYSDLPVLTDIVFTSYSDDNTGFTNSFKHTAYHLAGEYMYVEVQPSTTPKTYYWKYSPANVQADMSDDDPASLAYIKNRAVLDTTSNSGLATGTETIKGTVRLHKISKSGMYSDLINAVGRGSGNGEIFNTYSGQFRNTSMGLASHAEGYHTEATGSYSHAEGYFTAATGEKAHVEGYGGAATGEGAHAENINTTAGGIASHAEGDGTRASGNAQHAQGKFNVVDSQNTYAHIVGNGTADNARSNAHTLDWNGNAWFKGDIRVGGTSWDTGTPVGGGSVPYKKTLTNASQNYSVSNNVVTVTDSDVTASTTDVVLYPADVATETWLENNLSSCIITQSAGSFSFTINSSLPSTFSMYYIITEVQ